MPTLVVNRPVESKPIAAILCSAEVCTESVDPKTDNWTLWATVLRQGRMYHICPRHDPYDPVLPLKTLPPKDGSSAVHKK